jgi:hypothetical protein
VAKRWKARRDKRAHLATKLAADRFELGRDMALVSGY